MTERSIAHGTFTIERHYKHPVSKGFSAWSNPKFKPPWFRRPDPAQLDERLANLEQVADYTAAQVNRLVEAQENAALLPPPPERRQ